MTIRGTVSSHSVKSAPSAPFRPVALSPTRLVLLSLPPRSRSFPTVPGCSPTPPPPSFFQNEPIFPFGPSQPHPKTPLLPNEPIFHLAFSVPHSAFSHFPLLPRFPYTETPMTNPQPDPNLNYSLSATPPRSSPLPITSFVCGCLLCIPIIPGLIASIFGVIGIKQTQSPHVGGKGFAIAGLILGLVNLAGWGTYIILAAIAIRTL